MKIAIQFYFLIFLVLFITDCSQEYNQQTRENLMNIDNSDKLIGKILSFEDKSLVAFNSMIDKLNESQVVFLGEIHTNTQGHQFQLRIVESLYDKQNQLTIAMEMFERDVQSFLDKYLTGEINEKIFLIHSRPWFNYRTDYRPIVEFAKSKKLPVIAMNIPRRIARQVAKQGKSSLDSLSEKEKNYMAKQIEFNYPEYKEYFISRFPTSHPMSNELIDRFFWAQLVKDETMAESIVSHLKENPSRKVVTLNGSVHSNYGLAIPALAKKRDKNITTKLVTMIPLDENEKIDLEQYLMKPKIADYIIFVEK